MIDKLMTTLAPEYLFLTVIILGSVFLWLKFGNKAKLDKGHECTQEPRFIGMEKRMIEVEQAVDELSRKVDSMDAKAEARHESIQDSIRDIKDNLQFLTKHLMTRHD